MNILKQLETAEEILKSKGFVLIQCIPFGKERYEYEVTDGKESITGLLDRQVIALADMMRL